MSTSCVYPLGVEAAFRLAQLTGFDAVEVMVNHDPQTRDAAVLARLSERYSVPIASIHAPVLSRSQLVWGTDPREKLARSAELAAELGASVVVVHPPFRWQPRFARSFENDVREITAEWGIDIAVENMFTSRFAGRELTAYAPSDNPVDLDVDHTTLDFSHAALAGRDAFDLATAMGSRLRHVHLCDGTAPSGKRPRLDEHLIPGTGGQRVAEVLRMLANANWDGALIAEIHVPGAHSARELAPALRKTVRFARKHTRGEAAPTTNVTRATASEPTTAPVPVLAPGAAPALRGTR
jgi:sugar phosphate isomerase/epimerase